MYTKHMYTKHMYTKHMYTKQKLQVKWGCRISSQLTACNGVKQRAILSPILLSAYMDGLFEKLEKSGLGCHMGNHCTGGIGYADDLSLLTPTRSGLKVNNMQTITVLS